MASMTARAAPPLLALAVLLLARAPALAASASASIAGTLDVSITSPALKHWGITEAAAAFVPDADRSRYAQRLRAASSAGALCDALAQAAARDPAIVAVHVDGDGNLEHGASDEVRLAFRIEVAALPAPASGVVYLCSSPILAVIARGSYPDERFERVDAHRLRWASGPLTLHPGEERRVLGAASIDASRW